MRQAKLLLALAAMFLGSALSSASAIAQSVPLQAEIVTDGLRHPWGLDFLPGGDVIVTERPGQIRLLVNGKLSERLAGVPKVATRGQGGLLDIVVSPKFPEDRTIFFSFSEPGRGGAGTAVARAKLVTDEGAPRLEEVQVIFSMSKKTGTARHFGSRLVFARDGTLFITTGDRGKGERAQDMKDHAGAVLRINTDGSIPADNPSSNGRDRLPEIWSKGHRNIQGAALDPSTGALWTVEHGAKGGDEINRAEAGQNYGWPVISYGEDYSGEKIGVGTEAPGYEQPLHYWDPSIAPSGMAFYDGSMFPEWKGDLLVGSLKFAYLARLDRDAAGAIGSEEKLVEDEYGRIRDVDVAPDGSIWLLTDENNGAIVRLSRGD